MDPHWPRFWLECGCGVQDRIPSDNSFLGGWLDLDRVNIEETTGHLLLVRGLPPQARHTAEAFRLGRNNENNNSWKLLCQPLAARTFLECIGDERKLETFDQAAFVDAYWRTAVAEIAPTPGLKQQLDEVIVALTVTFALEHGHGMKTGELQREVLGAQPPIPSVNSFHELIDPMAGVDFSDALAPNSLPVPRLYRLAASWMRFKARPG
ncbi:hypothetical protein ACX80E_04830 [Arthrobacter sp. TMN-49]